ncbi:MAG: hypothetical protein GY835_10075, partial [bacterium]|nr:hypothetical protein [bacterium]
MKNHICIACVVMLAAAFLTSPAFAQLTSTANGVGYSGAAGDVTYFVGIDYRLEILELFENWLGEEDIEQLKPVQQHPLRTALLEDLAPWKDHQAVLMLSEFYEKYYYSTTKVILNSGELPVLNSDHEWIELFHKPRNLQGHTPEEFNRDISAWVEAVNSFIEESEVLDVFKKHENEYLVVVEDLYAATGKGQVLDSVLKALDFPEAKLHVIASPLINPGRNYAGYWRPGDSDQLICYFWLGPYRQIETGMFGYQSWSHVPATHNDQKQFIQLSIHEMTHMLVGDGIRSAIGRRGSDFVAALAPLEATMGNSYGPLPDNAPKYIDELVTRAYTMEVIRRFIGERDFRQMIANELPFTRGYAILMWKHLHIQLA